MNTKKLEIFCDFDGTITVGDTVDLLLEKLALPEWEALEELWQKGEISSGECMTKQIALIQGGWPAVEKVLDTVAVDRGLASFVVWCRQQKVAFNIVSDGLDRVIKALLAREKVSVDALWSNHLIEAKDGSLSSRFQQESIGLFAKPDAANTRSWILSRFGQAESGYR
ncbi:MAG: HAD-IB family phosphatase [Cyanobacteriota/Melainabacteria group bacterium]